MRLLDNFKYGIARALGRRISSIKNSSINSKAKIGNGSQIVNSSVGKYTYIYECTVIDSEIGAFCSIAPGVVIGGGAHPVEWVSTSPVFTAHKNVFHKNFATNEFNEYKKTIIGNDVWIGARCIIKSGVTIGDGAVIGMGSVLTHDVSPYEIWAGNPARCIRKRFDDHIVKELLDIQWWQWSDEKISKYAPLFSKPQVLFEELGIDEKVILE